MTETPRWPKITGMRRVVWRYSWVTALGMVVGLGWWWSGTQLPQAICGDMACGFVWGLLLLPAVPLASWLVTWFALRCLHVDRPGVTGALGTGVAVLLMWILLAAPRTPSDPATALTTPGVLVALVAVSFLIGGMLSSGPAREE